jgi:hypothetical protein
MGSIITSFICLLIFFSCTLKEDFNFKQMEVKGPIPYPMEASGQWLIAYINVETTGPVA